MMPDEYSLWVGLVYVFNLIVGTGALTLPAVFSAAGWLFSTVLIIMLCLVSFITVTFVIECMASANANLRKIRIDSHKIDECDEQILTDSEYEINTEETAIIQTNRISRRFYNLNTTVEMGQMADLFFQRWGRILFYISLCIYLFGDLAIYSTAIAKTLLDLTCKSTGNVSIENYTVECSDHIQLSKIHIYRLYVILFALSVCPFAYCKIQKTKHLQVLTTAFRWSAFAIMISMACNRLITTGAQGHPKMLSKHGVSALIGSCVYSFMCHHSLPGLIAPIHQKRNIVRYLALDYLSICGFYLLLALTGSFAFKRLEDLYTLNFTPTNAADTNLFLELIEYFLSAFPIFTLSTSFPVIAITLQNNIKAIFADANFVEERLSSSSSSLFKRRILFPTLAVAPPLIVAFVTHNLRVLVAITGAYAGVLIQYVMPALLVLCARRKLVYTIHENKFSSPFRHTFWIVFVLLWSFVCIVFVTGNLIRHN